MAGSRKEQIVRAAQRVYAREGFHRATIKKIAAEARLRSPALIYWYFKNKSELFRAAASEFSPLLQRLPDLMTMMDSPPDEVLSLIATMYLKTFDNPKARRILRIFLGESSRVRAAPGDLSGTILRVLDFIIGYLHRQVEMGRLRPHDYQSAARSFMGSLLVYVLGRELIPALRTNLPDPHQYVREVVSIFLSGLAATSQPGL